VPHIPQERGFPLHAAASEDSPPLEANTDNFFVNRFDPHPGQGRARPLAGTDEDFAIRPAFPAMKFINRHVKKYARERLSSNGKMILKRMEEIG
jgi:hypothetical protein